MHAFNVCDNGCLYFRHIQFHCKDGRVTSHSMINVVDKATSLNRTRPTTTWPYAAR